MSATSSSNRLTLMSHLGVVGRRVIFELNRFQHASLKHGMCIWPQCCPYALSLQLKSLDVASLCGKFSSHPQGIFSFLRSSLDVVSPPRLVRTGSLLDVTSLCGKFSPCLLFTSFVTHIACAFLIRSSKIFVRCRILVWYVIDWSMCSP